MYSWEHYGTIQTKGLTAFIERTWDTHNSKPMWAGDDMKWEHIHVILTKIILI